MVLDLVITETTLPDFLEKTAKTRATDIRALTINIDYDRLEPPSPTSQHDDCTSIHHSLTAQAIWNYLRNLARALQRMTSLTTFAFIITRSKCNFWVPRDILTDLVQNLPLRCRNLEIDTDNQDRVRDEILLDEYFCKAISRAITNLQHLRLRVCAMCPVLFQATSAPLLETVSVNCIGGDPLNGNFETCKILLPTPLLDHRHKDAASYIAQSLGALASTHCPNLKLATVTGVTHCDWGDGSTHHCYSIRDAVANRTYALPFVSIMWGPGNNILLRARDGEELMSNRTTTPLLGEGQAWKETTDGLRLPAAMFLAPESSYTAKPLPTATVAEWRGQNPTRSCSLWVNEERAGCRLIDATVIEGLGEHDPLQEDTPEGFARGDDKTDLWPAGEEVTRAFTFA
jgi:hypothetical protein